MANLKSMFKGEYMKGDDVETPRVVTISAAILEDDPFEKGKQRVVLSFIEDAQKLTLNKTNTKALIKALGAETDAWVGKKIKLAPVMVRNPKTDAMVSSIATVPA